MRPWWYLFAGILLVFFSLIFPTHGVAAPAEPVVAGERPVAPAERPRPISPWVNSNRHAGLIFSGSVVRVERVAGKRRKDVETVAVTFHVDHAFRGVRTGQTLTIREWAGLWVAQPRYRVGEKLLLFLYPPSRLGLTSPVSEVGGRFQVDAANRVQFSPAQRTWLSGTKFEGGMRRDGVPLQEFWEQVRRAGESE